MIIGDKEGYLPDEIRLQIWGKMMQDDITLSDLNI
jgi:hypothetical protein